MTDNGIGSSMIDIQMSSAAGAAPQGARRASEGAAPAAGRAPDPEVVATAKRRRFSASEKRQILAEADACTKPGELGSLLRRKRIYASMLSTWRRQRDEAAQKALAPQRRDRKADPVRAEKERIAQLEHEKARLERELTQARLIIEVQKRVSALIGIPMAVSTDEK